MKRLKVIAVGPCTGPVTGQRRAFEAAVSGMERATVVLDQYVDHRYFLHSLRNAVGFVLKALRFAFLGQRSVVYITLSRSRFGFVRDCFILVPALLRKMPVVSHLHGSDFPEFFNSCLSIERSIVQLVMESIEYHIVLTEGMKDEIVRCLPSIQNQIAVVPNFVDASVKMTGVCSRDGALRVVFLSNILPGKGAVDAFKAVEHFIRRGGDATLVIAGAPIDRSEATKIESLTSNVDWVTVCGAVDHSEAMNILGRSDVLLFPSTYRSEAFPLVLLEAASAGCVVIAYDFRYIGEVVDSSMSILCPPGDILSLADALFFLSSERRKLRDMQESAESLAKRYSRAAYVRGVNAVVDSALA